MKNFAFYKKTVFALSIFFAILLNLSCTKKLEKQNITITKSDGTKVTILSELAIKPEERNFGFMERKHIPEGTGMLFVFENDQILSFWMKNTPTALSIAYITSDGHIKDIQDMKPYSLASIVSSGYVRYALEVPQGYFKKNGIVPGDFVDVSFLKNRT